MAGPTAAQTAGQTAGPTATQTAGPTATQTTAPTAGSQELPEEARAWLARTVLFESMLDGLRRGGTVIAADRVWTLTPPPRAERRDSAAA